VRFGVRALAASNRYLAQSNKSRMRVPATNRRPAAQRNFASDMTRTR
jgi:hypothetical protein